MNDEMMPPTEPTQQPVSVHDTPHKHNGAWPLIAGMLGVFLVLETIAIGYGVTRMVAVRDRVEDVKDTAAARRAEIEQKVAEAKKTYPPFFYAPRPAADQANRNLMVVDHQTGVESVAYVGPEGKNLDLVAVPQVGYSGVVYISLALWASDGGPQLYKLDTTKNNELTEIVGVDTTDGHYLVSPDQTKIAYVPFDQQVDKYATGNKLKVYDLVTGGTTEVGDSGSAYFWSTINDFSGSGAGYAIHWTDNLCLEASVYEATQLSGAPAGLDNSYVSTDKACIPQ